MQSCSSLVVVVAGLDLVVLRLVVSILVVHGVLMAERVVSSLVVSVLVLGFVMHILVVLVLLVVRDHSVVLVVDGTGVSFVFKFDVGLFLMVLLVVRVVVSWLCVVHGVLVNNVRVVVVLVVGHTLDEVVRLLVVIMFLVVMVVMEVIVVVKALVMVSVVSEVLMVGLNFVVSLNLMVCCELVLSVVVMWNVVMRSSVLTAMIKFMTAMVIDGGINLVKALIEDVAVLLVAGKGVMRNFVLHLSSEEDLREGKTDRVAVLIEVLVLPLG